MESIGRVMRHTAFRPVFYISPLIIAVIVVGFIFLAFPWDVAVGGILLVVLALLVAVSWRLSVAIMHIQTETYQMHSIIENLSTGVLAYDANFRVTIFNSAAQEIYKIDPGQLIGTTLSASMASDPSLALLVQTVFSTLAPTVVRHSDPGMYPQIVDIVFDEPKLSIRVSTDRIFNEKKEVAGFIKLITDKTRETELLKSKTEFIAVAAHQLRTPLTAVNWVFGSLQNVVLKPEDKEILKTGSQAAEKMLKTVNDLLDVSKMEEGRFGYDFEETDIVAYLQELLSTSLAVAKQYNIKLYFQRPTVTLPHVFIDKQKLSMVIYNLVDNAIKYNVQNGQVTVGVALDEKDSSLVRVWVQDTGIGIPADQINKLFSKFFRAENAIKTVADGTGLGLYIARNVILRHGGTIWVESEINRGSTFYFTLPADQKKIPKKELTEFEM